VKTINVTFTDEEYEQLVRLKNWMDLNWHDFILRVLKVDEEKETK